MATKRFSLLSLLILAAIILSACAQGTPVTQQPNNPDLAHTQAVQTVNAVVTQIYQQTQNAPQPTWTPAPTATLAPTATPLPTNTPFPTPTSVPPTPTAVPLPCNLAAFVKDVSVKDGTVFGYGDKFTKTWRVQNAGSCTWTTDYTLVYRTGNQMDGSSKLGLSKEVRPGETVDLSINLVAPNEEGKYTGYWALKSDSGQIFGIGADGSQAMWVSIKVENTLVVNYTKDICSGAWSTNAAKLECPIPGNNQSAGYFYVADKPVLEGGYKDNESALIMIPPAGEKTYIEYKTDDFKVENQHFRAVIGCVDGATNCNVKFTLDYQIEGQSPKGLGTWIETYDKSVTKIDVDLSFLAGKDVRLLLTVMSNGSASGDVAFWLLPALYK